MEDHVKFVTHLFYYYDIKSGGRYATVFGVRICNRFGQQQYLQGASAKVGNLTDPYCLACKNFVIIELKEVNSCLRDTQCLVSSIFSHIH